VSMRIAFFIAISWLLVGNLYAQETGFSELERFHEEGIYVFHEQYAGPTPKDQRPKSFRGYTKMRSQFVALCKALKNDGRVEMIQERIYPHQQKRDDCIACKPLMKTFNKACTLGLKTKKKKPRRGKKVVEDEVETEKELSDSEIFKQRLPSLSVHTMLSEIFSDIVDEPALAEESFQAVKVLAEILKPTDENTAAEREYLSSMLTFIEGPFRPLAHEQEKKAEIKEEGSIFLDTGWTIQDEQSYSFDTSAEY
ncbi:MAG: hypothetical protein KDD62_05400, partial [Bdellovibrionales bacterium]|nr:hypothetical protein [Bdellovibrionales bacterium]